MKNKIGFLSLTFVLLCWWPSNVQVVRSQSIITAPDGTGTVVNTNGDRFDIQGGTLSGDGANLFHSFQQFGLNENQIANFLSNPTIQNILARIVGGDPSIINGLIQVSGGASNLFLMNPAGVIFGSNAHLNVPGDFTATTATGISFNQGIFKATGLNDYQSLIGSPNAFIFDRHQGGIIINAGDLNLEPGHNLALLGGTVINTGNLTAPGGKITIAAVPNTDRVKISQEGMLLSLEVELLRDEEGEVLPIRPLDLPALLTGPGNSVVTGLQVNSNGEVMMGETILPVTSGMAISGGSLSVRDGEGESTLSPEVRVLGDRIALIDADIDVRSVNGGGNVFIGGQAHGGGDLITANRTYISSDSHIFADSLGNQGNGGQVIVWSNEITGFYGEITAQGGLNGGDGGFVEVSGKENLDFQGNVNLAAFNGDWGTLLLDPTDIIINLAAAGGNDGELAPNTPAGDPLGQILAGHGGAVTFNLSDATLNAIAGPILLEATNQIRLALGNNLNFNFPVVFKAPSITINGNISGTNLTFDATNSLALNGAVSATGNLVLRADAITIANVSGTGNLVIETASPNVGIAIGTPVGTPSLDLEPSDLNGLHDGFSSITIGRTDGTGTIEIFNGAFFNDPVNIRGAADLIGPNSDTTWTLTGANSGTLSGFPNGASFNNIQKITSGTGNDTFVLNSGVNFNGVLDGGPGFDRLDYTLYGSTPNIDLANHTATGTNGVFRIEEVLNFATPIFSTPTPPLPLTVAVANQGTTPQVNIPSNIVTNQFINSSLNLSERGRQIIGDPGAAIDALEDGNIRGAVVALEGHFSQGFKNYFGKSFACGKDSAETMQKLLQDREKNGPSRSAIIYIFARLGQLDLILIPPEGEPLHYTVPVAKSTVLETLKVLQQEITNPVRRQTTTYLPPAQQLYQWLIAPLEADLNRLKINTLIFNLDEGLRTLPIAVLHDGKKFLVEKYGLNLIPCFSLNRERSRPQGQQSVLAIGLSQFTDKNSLPAVPLELETIRQQMKDGKIALNNEATLANFQLQQGLQSFDIIHIATHGEFQPGEPSASYLQLWDRTLTLDQMGLIKWGNPPADLLVLSACRTALGSTQAEYGFAGLALQTGVNSALASLWYANDVATLGLMSEFYRLLGSSLKVDALREAQMAMLSGRVKLKGGELIGDFGEVVLPKVLSDLGDRSLQHPYYWAGFTMIGSPW